MCRNDEPRLVAYVTHAISIRAWNGGSAVPMLSYDNATMHRREMDQCCMRLLIRYRRSMIDKTVISDAEPVLDSNCCISSSLCGICS